MNDKPYILFDPTQLREFGLEYFQSEGFSYRYQFSKKLFWKAIYIPFGPICEDLNGFEAFLKHVDSLKFTRLKIDLPLILDENIKKGVVQKLKDFGFKESAYVQDEETILVSSENYHLNSRNMRYVRQGLRDFDIEIKEALSDQEFEEIYEIYKENAARIGFKPKPVAAFKTLNDQSLTSIAYHKNTRKISGFLLGYKLFLPFGKTNKKSLRLIFTGMSNEARESKVGFALHYLLFNEAFEKHSIDLIDFHTASRSKKRSYVEFKKMFGGEFVSFPGSFEKINLI